MKVLVVGGGGREHAIVRALGRSPQHPDVLCAPGNPGILRDARVLDVGAADVDGIARAAVEAGVELVVGGPEAPLVAGLAAAARLEGSKAYSKEVMLAAGVPTAAHAVVEDVDAGMAAIPGYPAVIKA